MDGFSIKMFKAISLSRYPVVKFHHWISTILYLCCTELLLTRQIVAVLLHQIVITLPYKLTRLPMVLNQLMVNDIFTDCIEKYIRL